MNLEAYDPYVSMLVAGAVGLLVGLERERPVLRQGDGNRVLDGEGDGRGGGAGPGAGRGRGDGDERGVRPPPAPGHQAGARTFTLVALAGGLSVMLAKSAGPLVPVAVLAAVAALAVAGHRGAGGRERSGITTEVALVFTCLMGMWACASDLPFSPRSRWGFAAALGVVATALLTAKPILRRFATRLVEDDVVATTKFLIVAVVLLPLLPDADLGPFGAWNPRDIGWVVVLVAAISFVGYLASRLLGERGILVTALVGGLISSTAVTVAFAGRAKSAPDRHRVLAAGIVAACAVMFLRIVVVAGAVAPVLVEQVAAPALAAMAVAGLGVLGLVRQGSGARSDTEPEARVAFSNPFELGTALRFGVLFALVMLAAKAANLYLGTQGLYAAAAVAGLTDVDAITLSAATMARSHGIDPGTAAAAVGVAAASNSAVKSAFAYVLGGRRLGAAVAVLQALAVAAGAVVFLVTG